MAEWVPRSLPFSEPSAASRIEEPKRRRFPGRLLGSLLFPAMTAAVGAATAGSLFAAGFMFLMQPAPAVPSAFTSPPKRAAEPRAASRTAAKAPPPLRGRAARSPAMAERAAALPPEGPPAPAARFAIAEGDARFAGGDAPGARFFYEEAVDAGDADGALRMGETFDPAFLAAGRLRLVPGDREAAMFWYRHAFALGSGTARQRLDELEREPADDLPATGKASEKFRRRAARRYDREVGPPRATFYETPSQVSYPRADGP